MQYQFFSLVCGMVLNTTLPMSLPAKVSTGPYSERFVLRSGAAAKYFQNPKDESEAL